jgi:hypothetical protein
VAEDILTQLESREVCECEATMRSVAAHEVRRGRALATAVRSFLIEIEDGEACMKAEAPVASKLAISPETVSAAVEFNDQIRQRVKEIQQLIENGGS